ncbi:MAG TPA: hypothetical protein VF069_22265 [Streptosporangiaceae bacterium]
MHADHEELPERASRPAAGLRRAQHCVLFGCDVAEFTDDRRDDEVQLAVRAALYRLISEAFDDAHLPWEECLHEDRGDGILVVIPARMPSATVIDPLLENIRGGLRRHNRLASEAAEIRLRTAVHIGEVHRDPHGLAGVAVNHLFRLLDAPVLRGALAAGDADVALIVSDYVYESVVKHGPGMVDPATFRPVAVAVKRTQARGWIHLPGAPPAVVDPAGADPVAIRAPARTGGAGDPRYLYGTTERATPTRPEPPPAPAQGFVFYGPTTIHGDAVAGDKVVGGKDAEDPPA